MSFAKDYMNRQSLPTCKRENFKDQTAMPETDLHNLSYREINSPILKNPNSLGSLLFPQWTAFTTGETWANWASKAKLRLTLGPFVLMKLGMCGGDGELAWAAAKASDYTMSTISPLPKKKIHEWGGWLSSKCQMPIWVLMNLQQPLGFAPAGEPVHFPSTCSSASTDPPSVNAAAQRSV